MKRGFAQPRFLAVLLVLLVGKLVWDAILVAQAWPEHSRPKFGIVMVLPVLIAGLYRGRHWALNLTGVVAVFWITFLVARMVMGTFTVGSEALPDFPWSNLVAFPALVFVLNNLRTDEELREGGPGPGAVPGKGTEPGPGAESGPDSGS